LIRGNPELGLLCFLFLAEHRDPTARPTIYSNSFRGLFQQVASSLLN
jgi:hypothetical protein